MVTGARLSNAKLVLADEVVHGHLIIEDGCIAAVGRGPLRGRQVIDCNGDWLLPGMVEVHTDHLERQVHPRAGVSVPMPLALRAHDAQLLGAGITTACNALTVGADDDGGLRERVLLAACEALRTSKRGGPLRVAHLLHLRAELPCADLQRRMQPILAEPSLRVLSAMDHTPGQRQFQRLEDYLACYGQRLPTQIGAQALWLAGRLQRQACNAERNLAWLGEMARARGLCLASHDDTDVAHVALAVQHGARVSEFPTTLAAARAAHAAGLSVVAGAPNLVLGGSQSGNVSVLTLARAGCLDVLSSDYIPCSLLAAVACLHRQAGWTWPRAVGAVSQVPAQLLGLQDRGRIAPGLRADLLRVRGERLQHLREVWVAGRRCLGG